MTTETTDAATPPTTSTSPIGSRYQGEYVVVTVAVVVMVADGGSLRTGGGGGSFSGAGSIGLVSTVVCADASTLASLVGSSLSGGLRSRKTDDSVFSGCSGLGFASCFFLHASIASRATACLSFSLVFAMNSS